MAARLVLYSHLIVFFLVCALSLSDRAPVNIGSDEGGVGGWAEACQAAWCLAVSPGIMLALQHLQRASEPRRRYLGYLATMAIIDACIFFSALIDRDLCERLSGAVVADRNVSPCGVARVSGVAACWILLAVQLFLLCAAWLPTEARGGCTLSDVLVACERAQRTSPSKPSKAKAPFSALFSAPLPHDLRGPSSCSRPSPPAVSDSSLRWSPRADCEVC